MSFRPVGIRGASLLAATLALAAGSLALAPVPAEARTFVSLGFGFPLVAPAPVYYPPPYYYSPPPPPPVYYAPPPESYAPAYAPAAAPVAPPPVASQECREYTSTTTIDGRPQRVTGTACRQPDGSWRIVR